MVKSVSENINFAEEEEKVYQFWNEQKIFAKCLTQSEGKPRYTFYDGPPFATGLPHYGHILAGTIKDIVTRWAHQSGYHVERRFGWDTHGLPVEFEIDKALDIKGPQDVAKMGIKAYNDECRKIVMRYSSEWKTVVGRLGRWIDFENDYKTMYPWFMETVWWVFKQLYSKGLVYRGVKVMPYSTGCNTPLSNFESGQNYKEVVDPAVIVSFPLEEDPAVSILAWTTTPWTLPSNLACCVNPELDYVKVKEKKAGKIYILMEARLTTLFKKPAEYEVLEKMKGKALENKRYVPLFTYFESWKERGAFRVLCDSYVTAESGTGIVHQAPYFGEDDNRVCLANGIIKKDGDMVCPVDASGKYTEQVTHFAGLYVKDADKEIMKHLKSEGRLVSQNTVKHSYPFCWRSDTPLLYRAVPSWFVRVESFKERLLTSNEQTYWVPDFVKEKRFGNWLREARDWAISRNRYWGTPIPLWISDDGEEVVCVGSIAELAELSGITVDDLHRDTVDQITIPSKLGKGDLKRVSEVFDCWFESGSMPYAQAHYPFENRRQFEDSFPADFIAEGVDQTRGWFYTLLVLSTALFDKPPFKNLIVNGLVLASDGQKMSKRKKNYPDPLEVVNKFGADSLRLYLINSPVVRAENLRFREEGVRDLLKEVFLPWYNAYRFLVQNIELYVSETKQAFVIDSSKPMSSVNLMDRWIMSFTQSLIRFVKVEMKAYRLYTVVPRLVKYVDNLTNWYVRMNRKRFKGDGDETDRKAALETLTFVLVEMVQLMGSFTPFITEMMYQNLKTLFVDNDKMRAESLHHLMLPEVREDFIDEEVERRISRMQTVIEVGRILRDRRTLPTKYPLPEITVISKDETALADVQLLQDYVLNELNVRSLSVTSEKEKFGVQLKAEADIKALGLRLRGDSKPVIAAIRNLTDAQLSEYQDNPDNFEVNGVKLEDGELRVQYSFGEMSAEMQQKYEVQSDGQILVLLNVQPDTEMMEEGIAREVVNRVQKLRKKAQLVPTDAISVFYNATGDSLTEVVGKFNDYISNSLKAHFVPFPVPDGEEVIIRETSDLKDSELEIAIVKKISTEP
ncbi:Isoleucine--tRNA ligase, cytoplasmic [Halotydeus destructor]|nr:Isoleucine--tRNA ligase, cytoplasmic [Halotydeus destructor]